MVTSILVPLDGSALAEAALEPARDLAAAFGAPLVLFRACWTASGETLTELERLADKLDGVAAGSLVGHGFADTAIARAMADRPDGIVCMSTRGHTGAGALLLGSVAEDVLASVACPVVLVGPACAPHALARPDGPVVVGFDGSERAAATAAVAADWARTLGGEVHLVTVVHRDGERVGALEARSVQARAHQLVEELQAGGVAARSAFPQHVDPARGLTHYARDRHAALLAVPSPERSASGIGHAVLGEVALRIVRHAPAPVLVAPAR